MECAWQVEIDKACRALLKRRFKVEVHNDVSKIKGKGKRALPPADVICGGFPCQDVSVAGKRAGLAGKRSGLFWEFARIIDEFEPGWFVIENVPGLLSSCGCAACVAVGRILRIHSWIRRRKKTVKCAICDAGERMLESHKGRDFALIIRWLADRGYGVCWRVLDAQYFGLAQRRRRVFIVGSISKRERPVGEKKVPFVSRVSGLAAEVLFERTSLSGDIETLRQARKVTSTLPASGAGTSRPGGQAAEPGFYVEEEGQEEVSKSLVASEGGIDREDKHTLITPKVFDARQITSKEHQSQPSEISQPLNTKGEMSVFGDETPDDRVPKIYQWASGGGDDLKDSAQTLRAGAEANYQFVTFQQNTRDEVRMIDGDGQIAGAINATPGAKQQNYVADVSGTLSSGTLERHHQGSNPIPGLMIAEEMQGANGALQARDGKGIGTTIDDKIIPVLAVPLTHGGERSGRHDEDQANLIAWKERAGGGVGGKGFLGSEDHAFALDSYIQRVGVRRLTPVECERLQGFPDDWTDDQSDSVRYRQLGNAVAVPCAKWIGWRIKAIVEKEQHGSE